jgi:hypothetical protein
MMEDVLSKRLLIVCAALLRASFTGRWVSSINRMRGGSISGMSADRTARLSWISTIGISSVHSREMTAPTISHLTLSASTILPPTRFIGAHARGGRRGISLCSLRSVYPSHPNQPRSTYGPSHHMPEPKRSFNDQAVDFRYGRIAHHHTGGVPTSGGSPLRAKLIAYGESLVLECRFR